MELDEGSENDWKPPDVRRSEGEEERDESGASEASRRMDSEQSANFGGGDDSTISLGSRLSAETSLSNNNSSSPSRPPKEAREEAHRTMKKKVIGSTQKFVKRGSVLLQNVKQDVEFTTRLITTIDGSAFIGRVLIDLDKFVVDHVSKYISSR